jgi:hypothetical protein
MHDFIIFYSPAKTRLYLALYLSLYWYVQVRTIQGTAEEIADLLGGLNTVVYYQAKFSLVRLSATEIAKIYGRDHY